MGRKSHFERSWAKRGGRPSAALDGTHALVTQGDYRDRAPAAAASNGEQSPQRRTGGLQHHCAPPAAPLQRVRPSP